MFKFKSRGLFERRSDDLKTFIKQSLSKAVDKGGHVGGVLVLWTENCKVHTTNQSVGSWHRSRSWSSMGYLTGSL